MLPTGPFLERSLGHLAFIPDTHGSYWEYWERDGHVWRQSVSAPVMPDGYRSGRWYAYARPEVVANLKEGKPWHTPRSH